MLDDDTAPFPHLGLQRHHGIDAPIEQVVGALNTLDA